MDVVVVVVFVVSGASNGRVAYVGRGMREAQAEAWLNLAEAWLLYRHPSRHHL
jgi:hypothetical protein